ncbi:DUF2203 domain-containing protein [Candidatus Peregrinibacteria bacterium]|nr:MAG: DUF2203 domain-containing protein [Candidatus Peregrinibacteria bacterium]
MSRTFSVSEANRALLFVKPVIEDLQALIFNLAAWQKNPEGFFIKELDEKIRKIQYHFEELKQVGCLCRDPERGLVDFPSFYRNEPVFLCWSLGEEAVTHWHHIQENNEQRKPIDELFLEANSKSPQAVA